MIVGERSEVMVFLTHVAITIIVALTASLLIAQTLVPMLAARLPVPPKPKQGALIARLTRRYERSLRWVVRHPRWSGLGIIIVCVIGILPMALGLVKVDMWPQDSGRRLQMPYHIEGQHSIETVEATVDRIEEYLFSRQEEFNIEAVYSYYQQDFAVSTLLLTDDSESTLSTREVIERIEADLPLIAIGSPSFDWEQQGGGEGFSLQISGDSTEVLNGLGDEVVRMLGSVEGLKDLRTDAESGEQEIRVAIDRVRAAAQGLTAQDIAEMISIAMRGENLREFRGEFGEVAVNLAFRENDRQSVEQLNDLPLFTPDGRRVSLGSVANLSMGRSPETIQRTDRQTSVMVTASMEGEATMDDVREPVKQLMDQFQLPPGYAWKFGRGFERNDETQATMVTNMLLGVACIFLVMAALFESLVLPFSIILGSIVFSIFGVFLFFAATGTTFSFMAMIGIMILIGVVVNNGIVLVDHINNLRIAGAPRSEAIVIAGRDRLRPILMTVATTIVGLTPLAVGNTQIGGDGPPYYPMARAIIGGLAFSTVVSLLVVPALYLYFDNLAAWGRRIMRTARSPKSSNRPKEPPPELTTTTVSSP